MSLSPAGCTLKLQTISNTRRLCRAEQIDPEVRHVPELLEVRVDIYHALKTWDLLQVVAKKLRYSTRRTLSGGFHGRTPHAGWTPWRVPGSSWSARWRRCRTRASSTSTLPATSACSGNLDEALRRLTAVRPRTQKAFSRSPGISDQPYRFSMVFNAVVALAPTSQTKVRRTTPCRRLDRILNGHPLRSHSPSR